MGWGLIIGALNVTGLIELWLHTVGGLGMFYMVNKMKRSGVIGDQSWSRKRMQIKIPFFNEVETRGKSISGIKPNG